MLKVKILVKMKDYRTAILFSLLLTVFLGCSSTSEENPPRSNFPSIAVDKNNLYLAWQHAEKLQFQIQFNRVRRKHRDSSKEAMIFHQNANCIYPDIAVNADNAYIVWSQTDKDSLRSVMFTRSQNTGKTWSKPKMITSPKGNCEEPKIAVEGDNLYVVYEDEREGECQPYFLKSRNGGKSWSQEINLSKSKQHSNEPDIAVENGEVYVSWHEKIDGSWEIVFRKSRVRGDDWGEPKRLTFVKADSYYPSLAVDDGVVHVVWHDLRNGDAEIYYKRSRDQGETWEADVRLTKEDYNSVNPDIVARKSKVFVSWEDLRSGYYQIYVKKSENGGDSWSKDMRLTRTQFGAGFPEIAELKENIYIVWTDTRSGADQVYFRSSSDFGKSWNEEMKITE